MLRIAEAKIKDQTRVIKFTLFHDLIDKVKEDRIFNDVLKIR